MFCIYLICIEWYFAIYNEIFAIFKLVNVLLPVFIFCGRAPNFNEHISMIRDPVSTIVLVYLRYLDFFNMHRCYLVFTPLVASAQFYFFV